MNKVHNLLDDMALVCECGCVGFNYLKSHKLECQSCGKQTDIIKNAVDKFLSWTLPDDFSPDGGINFKPHEGLNKEAHKPTGTNLLNAEQAKEMITLILAKD